MSQDHIQEHVDLIAKHEQEFLAQRTHTERIGDAIASFAGGLIFVSLHIVIFAAWVVVNTLHLVPIPHFDPAPYSLLGILLLAEKEITAVVGMDRQIAGSMGLQKVSKDKELEQLSQHTSIEDMAQTIKDSLPSE
jgi:uncharacterized membrane protein